MLRLGFLSARYWQRRRGRGAITVLGVGLGVALIVSVGLVNDGILKGYETLSQALAGRAQLEVRSFNEQGMDAVWLDRIRRVGGVAAAAPLLEKRSFLFAGDRNVPLLVRGVDPAVDAAVRPLEITLGRALEPSDLAAIVLAEPVREGLGLGLGDTVDLLTPDGFVSFRVVGAFAGLDPLNAPQSRVAMVPLAALQQSYFDGRQRFGQIDLMLHPEIAVEDMRRRLAPIVASVAFVEQPLEQAKRVAELSRGVRFMLLLSSLMSLVAAAYLIANNALAAVSERQQDLATLRALGLGRGTVRRWLLAETLVMSGVGSLIGAGVGTLAAGTLAHAVSSGLVSGLEVGRFAPVPTVILAGLGAGVLVSLLAAYPAIHWISCGPVATRLGRRSPPGWTGERPLRWVPPLGLAILMLALTLQAVFAPAHWWSLSSLLLTMVALLLAAWYLPAMLAGLGGSLRTLQGSPLWLRLAADSLRQHRQRTGSVAASLMITLSILVGVFGMASSYRSSAAQWVDEMFGWDLMVSSSTRELRAVVPLNERLRDRLEELEGVALASPERFTLAVYGQSALGLYAFDMADSTRIRRFNSVAGVPGEALPDLLAGERRVAISSTLAPRIGLGVGDSLRLSSAEGPLDFDIVAVVQDPGAAADAVYMDREVYARDWKDRAVDSFALLLTDEAVPGEVAERVRESFAGLYPLQVVSAATFKAEVNRMVRETFGLSQGLVLLAVLVAMFGLMNATMIGAWQLRQQLAILRALGAPIRLLSKALLAEAWLTGVLGGVVGLVMGTVLSSVLLRGVQQTSSLAVTWTWPFGAYLLVGFIALLGSLAAGYLPSQAAARTNVTEALRHE